MQIYTHTQTYQRTLPEMRPKKIAFVPTMGALHSGHLSLIKTAQTFADQVVVSIFVNPTQFNDQRDFVRYPRPLLKDIHQLEQAGAPILFAPTVDEMYPPKLDLAVDVDLGHLTTPLEGAHRPGHFEGVVTVVHRLLDIVKPHVLIMGQKDFQQLAIIREMIRQLKMPIDLVGHPIVRESDGLALSSRNVRIDPSLRATAPMIYEVLQYAQSQRGNIPPQDLAAICRKKLDVVGFKVEYVSIVDADSLQTIESWGKADSEVICVAAWLGDVRLIDNHPL